jgi:putative DNA primase/helicase
VNWERYKSDILSAVNVEELLREHGGEDIRTGPSDWMICCPFHGDNTPSLSVSLSAENGFNCKACGEKGSIIDLYGALTGIPKGAFKNALLALGEYVGVEQPKKKRKASPSAARGKIIASYDYRDASGALVFQALRLEPKGFRQRRPDGDGGWIWSVKGIKPIPYRLPEILAATKPVEDEVGIITPPVIVVEGEKDADRLWSLDIPATCNAAGAEKWTRGHSEAIAGKPVVIIPDNDAPGRKHAEKVAKHCKAAGCPSIRVLELPELPEKGDASDWLDAGHGAEELRKLIAHAPDWKPSQQQQQSTANDDEDDERQERHSKPKPAEVVAAYLETGARAIGAHGGDLLIYRDGCYRAGGEQHVARFVAEHLGVSWRPGDPDAAIKLLATLKHVEDEELNTSGLVNCANGLLDTTSGVLRPHTPDDLSTIQVAASWDPAAVHERGDQFLSEVLPDEETRSSVEEFLGYFLLGDCRHDKALMLTGEGANGKSILLRWIAGMLGQRNVSAVALQEFGGEAGRFRTAQLVDKLANICGDLSSEALRETGAFKQLTSGDAMIVEQKFGRPFVHANRAKLVFSANELPRTTDRTDGFFRRWVFVPFRSQFLSPAAIEERGGLDALRPNEHPADSRLLSKLLTPAGISYLFRLAVEGLRRLEQRGGFASTEATQQALQSYRLDSDSLAAFVEEWTATDGAVAKQDLYDRYLAYCEDGGYSKPFSARRCWQRLPVLVPGVYERRSTGVNRQRQWVGIRVLSSAEHEAKDAAQLTLACADDGFVDEVSP